MKGRFLFLLISLMVISLLGIILIQTSWINDAIVQHQQALKTHVNDALNEVNNEFEDDKARIFIEHRLGGMDSLINQVVVHSLGGHEADVQIHINNDTVEDENTFVFIDDSESEDGRVIELKSTFNHITDVVGDSLESERNFRTIERRVIENNEVIEESMQEIELAGHELQRIEAMLEQHTFESLWTGDINERISKKELQELLTISLANEGIASEFEFGVYNHRTDHFEPELLTKNFDTLEYTHGYEKELFPLDNKNIMDATLWVSLEDGGQYVWSKVWKMVTLSIAFTLLILLAFSYALYFIFKQKKISQIKNDFINNMTHELKTPLASISLATSSIKHPNVIGNQEEILRLAAIIEAEKERINHHVERVLDTAALDAGNLQLKMENTSINELLQLAFKNVNMALESVDGKIQGQMLEEVVAKVDVFHITNVFTNLLDNSIKYRSDETPIIHIALTQKGGNAIISIQDNGIGMTTKEQKLAFDPFYRAESGDIHTRKGFGLGLSYVKSIVEKHNGSVSITSKIGKGTKVEIIIPTRN